jgi:lysine 2,3-aminomutase
MSRIARLPASRSGTARSVAALAERGLVPDGARAGLEAVAQRYAVAMTPAMIELALPGDPADPIARQFVPAPDELVEAPGERADPIGDDAHTPVKGIVHRYPDRVLLKPVHVCPVYCRYCFRRERVGPGGEALSPAELAAALDYIRARPGIFEVILSGGDPLMLSPRRIAALVGALDAIAHVRVIRVHSRLPVADPEAITPALVGALAAEKAVYLVVHANHPREITAGVAAAAKRLARAGIGLLAQSVLLKGVNDDADTLDALFRALLAARIKPYYLHHADLAPGTAHFRTDLAAGQRLMRALRGRLSGLAQPTYVLDIPGGHGKVPVGPVYAAPDGEGWRVTDPGGARHDYPPAPATKDTS